MFTDLFIFLKVLRGCEAPKMPVLSVYYKQTTEPELTKRCILELKLWLQVTDQGQLIYSFWSDHTILFILPYSTLSCLCKVVCLITWGSKTPKRPKFELLLVICASGQVIKCTLNKSFPSILKILTKNKNDENKKVCGGYWLWVKSCFLYYFKRRLTFIMTFFTAPPPPHTFTLEVC